MQTAFCIRAPNDSLTGFFVCVYVSLNLNQCAIVA